MRFALCSILFATLAAPAVAATPPATVTLKIAPGNATTKGTPVTLTSTVTPTVRAAVPVAAGRVPVPAYDPLGLLYTFTAQQTWPCQESFTIQSSNSSTVSWNAPKAGTYTFAVDVKYKPTFYVGGMPKFLPAENLGNATHANYQVKPQQGLSHDISKNVTALPYGPPSGRRFLNLSIPNPPSSYWFQFHYTCYAGCSPASGSNRGASGVRFLVTLANPGIYNFKIDVDKVRDCAWLQSGSTFLDYHYSPAATTPAPP